MNSRHDLTRLQVRTILDAVDAYHPDTTDSNEWTTGSVGGRMQIKPTEDIIIPYWELGIPTTGTVLRKDTPRWFDDKQAFVLNRLYRGKLQILRVEV